jgi:hypothetical protein
VHSSNKKAINPFWLLPKVFEMSYDLEWYGRDSEEDAFTMIMEEAKNAVMA